MKTKTESRHHRHHDLGEADKLVTLLLPHRGRLREPAKRTPSPPLRRGSSCSTHARLHSTEGAHRSWSGSSPRHRQPAFEIAATSDRMARLVILELVREVAPEGSGTLRPSCCSPCPALAERRGGPRFLLRVSRSASCPCSATSPGSTSAFPAVAGADPDVFSGLKGGVLCPTVSSRPARTRYVFRRRDRLLLSRAPHGPGQAHLALNRPGDPAGAGPGLFLSHLHILGKRSSPRRSCGRSCALTAGISTLTSRALCYLQCNISA